MRADHTQEYLTAPPSQPAKGGDLNMLSLLATVEGERQSQHRETQHGNFKRFNFSAHGPAVDECQTAPLPDKRILQSWRFPQGKSYHLIILACLHCPASHVGRGSCSHPKGSTAPLHTENTHYHRTGIELTELQTCSKPGTVSLYSQQRKANTSKVTVHQSEVPKKQDKPSGEVLCGRTRSPLDNQSQA